MYDIVPYRPEHKGQVARLQRHLRSGDEAINAAYLEWKYERNPYLPAPLIYLAVHGGEVVGMRGMFGSCWEVGPGPEVFVVPCADDAVIAPAHRNRGLFGRIMAAACADLLARGHRVTFSLSAGAATLAGSLASGWRSVGSVREVSRVDRPASWRWRLGTRMRSWRGAWRWAEAVSHTWSREPFRRLDRVARGASAGSAIWCARAPRPEAMADLVRGLGHDGRARHVRDARYLAWRFEHPLHAYRFLLAGRDRLDGYLVLQASRHLGRRGVYIVDWEADSPALRRALLGAAIEWGRFAELSAWTMSLSEESRILLGEAGFVPAVRHRLVRQGPALLVRSVEPSGGGSGLALDGRRLLDPASWDMRMLYSMAG